VRVRRGKGRDGGEVLLGVIVVCCSGIAAATFKSMRLKETSAALAEEADEDNTKSVNFTQERGSMVGQSPLISATASCPLSALRAEMTTDLKRGRGVTMRRGSCSGE